MLTTKKINITPSVKVINQTTIITALKINYWNFFPGNLNFKRLKKIKLIVSILL